MSVKHMLSVSNLFSSYWLLAENKSSIMDPLGNTALILPMFPNSLQCLPFSLNLSPSLLFFLKCKSFRSSVAPPLPLHLLYCKQLTKARQSLSSCSPCLLLCSPSYLLLSLCYCVCLSLSCVLYSVFLLRQKSKS